jgi:RNA polymerase sigma-70 factor (ECF subfamily)
LWLGHKGLKLTPTEDPDRELVTRASQGDYASFERLVEKFQQRIFGLAFRIVNQREDAEDVTQRTMLSLVEHIDGFRGESSVSTWILRIATNHALQVLRSKRRKPTVSIEGNDDSYDSIPHPEFIAEWRDDPVTLAENREIRELADSAIRELDEKYRVVFILRDLEGLSVAETASATGLSEANVKVRLLRARMMLRERLTQLVGDESRRLYPDHKH